MATRLTGHHHQGGGGGGPLPLGDARQPEGRPRGKATLRCLRDAQFQGGPERIQIGARAGGRQRTQGRSHVGQELDLVVGVAGAARRGRSPAPGGERR